MYSHSIKQSGVGRLERMRLPFTSCSRHLSIKDYPEWPSAGVTTQGVARPSGRAGHAVAILRVAGNKDVLLVHGGRTKDHKLCRDTWLLELS